MKKTFLSIFFKQGMSYLSLAVIIILSAVLLVVIGVFITEWISTKSPKQALIKTGEVFGNAFAMPWAFFSLVVAVIFETVRSIRNVIPFRNFGEFFQWFGGADLSILRDQPNSVRFKKSVFGILMFITITFSSALAYRMWSDIFLSVSTGIIVAVLWYLIIWALDRGIVVFMDHEAGKKRVWVAVSRLVMIMAIAFVNTTFINIWIFNTEIHQEIALKKKLKVAQVNDSIANYVTIINNERDQRTNEVQIANTAYGSWLKTQQDLINEQRALITSRRDALVGEIEGRVGTHIPGDGAAAKAKKEALRADSVALKEMIAQFDQSKNTCAEYLALVSAVEKQQKREPELLEKISTAKKFFEERKEAIMTEKADGYSDRYTAMWAIAKKTPILFWSLFIFFFILESLVVLMKLMSGKDTYEEAIALQKEKYSVENQQNQKIDLQTKTNNFQLMMNDLMQTSIAQRETAAQNRKILFDKKNTSDNDVIKDFSNHMDAIESVLAGSKIDTETQQKLRKSMTEKFTTDFNKN
ncbi:MAG: DUF4407 domain-containing protein [Candidatus Nomurabacteria bacterium]|nr:DUF4407 domain-containing protein [Candidatus Nomurabacteria bacterium]